VLLAVPTDMSVNPVTELEVFTRPKRHTGTGIDEQERSEVCDVSYRLICYPGPIDTDPAYSGFDKP
jgi:hypothetical protein